MEKVIVIPEQLFKDIYRYTLLAECDCVCGSLLSKTYKSSKGNYFVFAYYITGIGLLDKPVVNPKKDEVVKKFLSLNKDYKKLDFQAHSPVVKKHYNNGYSSFLDSLDAKLILVSKDAAKELDDSNSYEYLPILEEGYNLQIDNWEMGKKTWKQFNTNAGRDLNDIENVLFFS